MMKRKKYRKYRIGLSVSLLILLCLLGAAAGKQIWENAQGKSETESVTVKENAQGKSETESLTEEENGQGKSETERLASEENEQGKSETERLASEENGQGKSETERSASEENEGTKPSGDSKGSAPKDGEENPSRDGEGSAPKEEKTREEVLEEQVQVKLNAMTLEEKAAQLFIITPEALTGYSTVTRAGEVTKAALEEYPVGGLIFFKGNLNSEEQVTEMLGNAQKYSAQRIGLPLFTAIDEEGGYVANIAQKGGFDVPVFPDIAEIGAGQDGARAYEVGNRIGEYLARMGFNLNFAPVADVLSNPENTVVKRRSYGSDPQAVSRMVLENLRGLQEHGVCGCVKHFPGHGATLGDTHDGYAYTDKTWEELSGCDLIPFRDSIAWGVDFVMVGHISLPQVTGDDIPASLSSYVINDLLREEMGYDGIVLTDALEMRAVAEQFGAVEAAVRAFLAGNDMLLMPRDFKAAYEGVLSAVREGRIPEERLDESAARILRAKLRLADYMEGQAGDGMEKTAL